MKHIICKKVHLVFLSILCTFILTTERAWSATQTTASVEQGEEEYSPPTQSPAKKQAVLDSTKSHSKVHAKQEKLPPTKQSQATKKTNEHEQQSSGEDSDVEYKSFPTKEDLRAEKIPGNQQNAPMQKSENKSSLKEFTNPNAATESNNTPNYVDPTKKNVEPEIDTKIEANKLVDPDEKTVSEKKFNGIIWFVVVFVVLLIVVFAFT